MNNKNKLTKAQIEDCKNNSYKISDQGSIRETNINTDIAINGSGFITVIDQEDPEEILYTRQGNFRLQRDGTYSNSDGFRLVAHRYNKDGSYEENFEQINTKKLHLYFKPTSYIAVSLNLNSNQALIAGKPITLKFPEQSINYFNKADTPIVPDETTGFKLQKGDGFKLYVEGDYKTYHFDYRGVITSKAPSNSAPIKGAKSANQILNMKLDEAITLKTKDAESKFAFTSSARVDTDNGRFNNLANLNEAINKTDKFISRIVGGKLNIAQKDGEYIEVKDTHKVLAEELGLATEYVNGISFSTLGNLVGKLNSTKIINANIIKGGNQDYIEFSLKDPFKSFRIDPILGNNLSWIKLSENIGEFIQPVFLVDSPNMSESRLTPHYMTNCEIVDSLGHKHMLNIGFAKIAPNKWTMEVWEDNHTCLVFGNIEFDENGSVKSIDRTLEEINHKWDNQANSLIKLDFASSQLTQLSYPYSLNYIEHDGIIPSKYKNLLISDDGIITAIYENGYIEKLYQIELASFVDPDSLEHYHKKGFGKSSAFTETHNSGIAEYYVPDREEFIVGAIEDRPYDLCY